MPRRKFVGFKSSCTTSEFATECAVQSSPDFHQLIVGQTNTVTFYAADHNGPSTIFRGQLVDICAVCREVALKQQQQRGDTALARVAQLAS